jgi:hypothetical protein
MKIKVLVISSLVALALMLVTLDHGHISKEQAIIMAEQFVTDNGYCSKIGVKSKLSFELLDSYQKCVDSLLKHRHNSLYCNAFCISDDSTAWHIGFLSTKVDRRTLDSLKAMTDLPGRCIIVSKEGNEIRMAHKTPLFSYFIKL